MGKSVESRLQLQITPALPILIATLGTEPQVITAALDLLARRGDPVQRVEVLHTFGAVPSITTAVSTLQEALANQLPLDLIPLCDQHGHPLADVETPQAAEDAFRTLYRQLWQAKRQGTRVHLLLAGGRKTLSVFAMVAAQLLFDEQDCLWHLYSAGDFLTSRRMHPTPDDDVHLISIPVLLRSYVSLALTHLKQVSDPFEALDAIRKIDLERNVSQAREFIHNKVSQAESKVVGLLVQEGLGDQEIADRLVLSPRTVQRHLRSVYRKAAAFWEIEDVSRAQLVTLLHVYYIFPGVENE
ncbi:MAG TPA: CRISPR-associated ring nuclease [Anaerolineaceae bacterium]